MARQFTKSYSHSHSIADDGSVEFGCSTDTAEWPWLTLGSHHPIVIQAQNFWTSVGAIMALGGMEDGQWSALTWTDWHCGDPGTGMAVRGRYEREKSGDDETYVVELFDAEGRLIVRMRGRGVVFRNRNFEEWRDKAKSKAQKQADSKTIEFAPANALGLGASEHALISQLKNGEAPSFDALITPENGLPPANPMLGGSGDHVNSVHMIETARQALCLLEVRPNVEVIGGEMELNRYVELGTPFTLQVADISGGTTRFSLEQLGRTCAVLTVRT
ncbi:hypothetical protein [uncultured Erythrobacter sp.]|uniref:hypothetical protein n=1 Tax=uncultured Erythrobacter sp. TaxID=263913 RepID=UPI00262D3E6E|nr:hypothetical protein [uncultured Erythrobacter sp.]